ncbi:Gibberellin regulated protein [Sesbania bispinosa]|nr:Gibberellin regulated protein [Sesbania bispinosa]
MARLLVVLILALIAISMVQTKVMASHGHGGHHYSDKRKYGPGSLKSYRYYGNKAVCPCYNNWKTKRGGPKCP